MPSESHATIIAAVVAGIVTVTGSAWSCYTSLAVQSKQTASDTQIAVLTQNLENQRLVLNVAEFTDIIQARKEGVVKKFLPDVLSDDKLKRRTAIVVMTALYPNECDDYFAQATAVAATLDPKTPATRPYVPYTPFTLVHPSLTPALHPAIGPLPTTQQTTPFMPYTAGSEPTWPIEPSLPTFPAMPLESPSELLGIAQEASKRAGKWTIRVSLDATFPEKPADGGAAYEVALLTKKSLPTAVFKTPRGYVTTTGVYDTQTEARVALRAMGDLSGRNPAVVQIKSLCEDPTANPLCAPSK